MSLGALKKQKENLSVLCTKFLVNLDDPTSWVNTIFLTLAIRMASDAPTLKVVTFFNSVKSFWTHSKFQNREIIFYVRLTAPLSLHQQFQDYLGWCQNRLFYLSHFFQKFPSAPQFSEELVSIPLHFIIKWNHHKVQLIHLWLHGLQRNQILWWFQVIPV